MKKIGMAVSAAALVATFVAPVGFYLARIDLDTLKLWMTAATVAWFAATPLWMERKG